MAVPFLPFVLQNLNTLIQNEVGLLCGVNKEMKKLSSTLSTIQDVLEDAEQKQLQDKHIQNWLKELNDAAYEADDILDEFATEGLQCESKGLGYGSVKKVSTSLLTCYPLQNILFRHKIGNRIKEITQKLDAIAANHIKFHLNVGDVGTRVLYDESRETSSWIAQPELYGRDEDKEVIVKVLVQNVCDRDDVSVYPILGIGGLGKTTLAQMVFNDDRVQGHFEPKIWVYVSQDFNLKRVIKAIIKSASGEVSQDWDLGSLQGTLRHKLNGKRYLIVFDDVWDENPDKWDALKHSLACGSKGASVIVTTRMEKVAAIMGTISPHHLSILSEKDCWLLFRQRAFGHRNEEHPNLVAIGKEIVKKCGGVPLAAKALGGLLRFKSQEKEWLHVKESEIWNLQDENSILPALRLSYFYLPLESRRCFAYCAIFPKGSEFQKRDLIHLWMANGYISCKGRWEPEDIGDQIWNELCLISFLQEVKYDDSNMYFMMHDLVHDLAQSIMKDECEMIKFNSSSNISNEKVRHVTLVVGPGDDFNNTSHKVVSLRTLRLQGPPISSSEDDEFLCDFRKFGSLRAFDAGGRRMTEFPSSIDYSKHLRYLNLSRAHIKQLPDSVCSLLNLQTLILDYCYELERLPQNMMYLRSLRHLYLLGCPLIGMPPKIGQLTNLKTLNTFVVGESTDCSSLAELKCLNLGGELGIKHLGRVSNPMDAKEANLVGKQNLSRLGLNWGDHSPEDEQVLEALQPHPNLKELVIGRYNGTRFPRWMSGLDLRNVVNIKLYSCYNCLQLPPLGQLPLLRGLQIESMHKVVEFPCGGGFPSLEELRVHNCWGLEVLSRDEGIFSRLRKIAIGYCRKLRLPHLSSPKELSLEGCCPMALNSISNLSSLTSLAIDRDKQTVCFPKEFLRNLTLLESLSILNCEKLEVLPEDLGSLVTLKSLVIKGCYELESLPVEGLRGLESLQSLCISHCPKIALLPASIKSLTKLQRIQIWFCSDELKKRCEKETGEDWYKIERIPEVFIKNPSESFQEIESKFSLPSLFDHALGS